MTSGSELHLVGNFPTQPLQIQYDMRFLYLDGAWRLNGFAVDAVSARALAGQYSARLKAQQQSNTVTETKV